MTSYSKSVEHPELFQQIKVYGQCAIEKSYYSTGIKKKRKQKTKSK